MVYLRGNGFMKKGFTLSEVLITMGIVGIIASITIPAVMKNYKYRVYATSIEKVYSQFTDAAKSIMADEQTQNLQETTLAAPSKCATSTQKAQGACYFLNEYFKVAMKDCGAKAYKPTRVCLADSYQNLDGTKSGTLGGGWYCVQTTNGMAICGTYNGANGVPTFIIDTNGPAEPNIGGRDLFTVDLKADGTVSDFGQGAWGPDQCGKINNEPHYYSAGCLNKLMQEGWKMNY